MSNSIKLHRIARLVGGNLSGDGELQISGASTIRNAKPGEITLADNPKFAEQLAASEAAAAIVPHDFAPHAISYIAVDNVHESFAKVVAHFRPPQQRPAPQISPHAIVSRKARIGAGVYIGLGAIVGDDVVIGDRTFIHDRACIMAGSRIAEDVEIHPGAVLYENTIIGPRCVIGANAVIGGYGFGYATKDDRHQRLPQLGHVIIEADVEIGAGSTIDRGTYDATLIGEGTKIDNLVMIGHNCRIGKHNILCAQTGLAGSVTTGDYVVCAGQVGIRDHVHIGAGAQIGAKAGVMADLDCGLRYSGVPAFREREHWAQVGALARLPEMRKQFLVMRRKLNELASTDSDKSDADNKDQRDAA